MDVGLLAVHGIELSSIARLPQSGYFPPSLSSTKPKIGDVVAKTQPTIIKVGAKGAYVNLNSVVSLGVVDEQAHNKLKGDYKGVPKDAKREDYEIYHTPTLSFYFIGKDELILRVGAEITQEEYDSAKAIIESVVFELLPKDARSTITNEAP